MDLTKNKNNLRYPSVFKYPPAKPPEIFERKRPITELSGKIITLCGSTRFKPEFEYWKEKLTEQGNTVLSVNIFTHADNVSVSEKELKAFDEQHRQKIDKSYGIFVIDKDGYIGESTQSEIQYARDNNKRVYFLSKTDIENAK